MDNNNYLDFDEAVRFLKTTPSTLYKWLQAGKVPAHKLGRQWRFLREELELHVSGKAPKIQLQKEALQFGELLQSRSKKAKENKMDPQLDQLAEKLIWDAFDHGSRLIHIYPCKGKYEISYRTNEGLDKLTTIQEDFFHQLDQSIQRSSTAIHADDSRRMYLQRSEEEAVQVRYQRLETVTGMRLTLRLWQPDKDIPSLDKIVTEKTAKETFESWLKTDSGIIAITGANGSGKTTTVLSILDTLKKQGRVVFTIEDTAEVLIDGVNHVEVKGRDPKNFNDAFDKIYSSDPDVLCFGMGSAVGIESTMYNTAYQAASTGHLVILHMDAPAPEVALEEMKKYISYEFSHLLVGISAQKLVREGKNRGAIYSFLESEKKKH
jgi:excisionase family DNA binding protein